MPNSATEQALPNIGSKTFHHLTNPSVTSNQQIPNLDSFNAGTTDRHSLPSSGFASMRSQSNQSSLSNAVMFIQFG